MIRFESVTIEGFGVFGDSGERSLPLSDQGLVLIEGDNRDTLAATSNGAGKTTVFKAISWVLFGRTIDGLTTDVIHRDLSKAAVYLRFSVDGEDYAVTRSRTASAGKVLLEKFEGGKWKDISQRKKRQTEASIVDLLGLDWDAFRCVCLFGQGDNARFASPAITDATRKDVLRRVLNLDRYERARDRARAMRDGIDAELDGIDKEARQIETALSSDESALRVRKENFKRAKRLADDGEKKKAEAIEAVVEAREELEAAEEEFESLDPEPVRALLEGLLDDYNALTDVRNEARAELREAKRAHEALSDDVCPECGTELDVDEEERSAALKRLERAKESDEEARREAEKAQEEYQEKVEEAQRIEKAMDRAELKVQSAEARVESRERSAREIIKEVKGAQSEVDRIVDEIAKLKGAIEEHERELDRIDDERTELEVQRSAVDWWVKGLGPKGVPAYAIEQALPSLNTHTNRHLLTLADGDLSVSWAATTTGSTGTVKEELTCTVEVEGMTDVSPSGGQWKKIELATELALAEVVREAGGPATNLLLLDEAIDGLDKEGVQRVCDWLQLLDYESAFVVSHHDAVQDSFGKVVTVVKEDGIATIEGV